MNEGLLPDIPEAAAEGLPDPRNILTVNERVELMEKLRAMAMQRRQATIPAHSPLREVSQQHGRFLLESSDLGKPS